MLAPTVDDLLAEMVPNIVDPSLGTPDRADAVYPSPAPMSELRDMGYRVVFYPDNGSGTGPDLTKPILATHPVIDPAIPSSDQGISIDYRTGTVRLSCAPAVGGDLKPTAGCVDPTTRRLNLYAVWWAVDTSLTHQTVAGLYNVRGDEQQSRSGAKVYFDLTAAPDQQAWWLSFSPTQRGAFVQDFDTAPARIGVDTKTGYLRHLTYSNVRYEWTMKQSEPPSDHTNAEAFELALADRTISTVSDSSYEPRHPGVTTPDRVIASPAQGRRNSNDSINDLLMAAAAGGYGTVHLRKGTHYVDSIIHIPPGTTLEGAGPQTVLEYTGGASTAVLKFGPNTPWGVYDYSYGTSYNPTNLLTGIKNRRVEGQDVCWNSNKKVWGVVVADVTSQAVWFNEMRTDGSWVLPGNGIDIKNNARPIFTVDSVANEDSYQYHTPGHTPRIDYHPVYNRYGAAWCVLDAVDFDHTALQVVLWETTADDQVTVLDDTIHETSYERFTNPSVAFNRDNTADSGLRVVCMYRDPNAYLVIFNQDIGSFTNMRRSLDVNAVVSSTDITVLSNGDSLIVWSERAHQLLGSALANGTITSNTPRRFTGVALPQVAGIVQGSKLHHLNTAAGSTQGGKDFVVTNVQPTYIEIQDEGSTEYLPVPEALFFWAISPPTKLRAVRTNAMSSFGTPTDFVDSDAMAVKYNQEMREPDFVRISRGSDGLLVVFQAFNTTAFLARTKLHNFDNNINASFLDGNPACKSTGGVYREHVSTCSVLLNELVVNMVPGKAFAEAYATYDIMRQGARPLAAMAKSLGASDPLVGHPNVLFHNATSSFPSVPFGQPRGPHLEISARHLVHKWTITRPMSLIPDVTWTGQDWAVVTPTQAMIESDTGTIRISGGNHYLVDPTLCFGGDSWNAIDGNWLPRTTSAWVCIMTGTPAEYQIGEYVSDHCVRLTTTTPFSDGQKVTWRQISDTVSLSSSNARDYGRKILGFRVSSDGKLIQGSSRLTDHMPPLLSNVTNYSELGWRTETVSRRKVYTNITPNVSTGGANDPMTFGTLYADYPAGSERGGWDSDYPTSRISGHIGFKGICAGAPIPPGAISPYECPMAALAWGETFYALAARQTSGKDSLWLNRTLMYRQNFGPYNADVRNLSVVGKNLLQDNWTGTTKHVQHVSRRHVYTRWGLPNSPSGGFATDGYRNCFVYPSQIGQPSNTSWTNQTYDSYFANGFYTCAVRWVASYTDAIGDNAITYFGPPPRRWVDGAANGYIKALPASDNQLREDETFDPDTTGYYPSSPVVLWTGNRFMAFWTEEEHDSETTVAGSYICMAAYPGGDSTYNIDQSLGSVWEAVESGYSSAKVSCGLGVGSAGLGGNLLGNQITVCDAAYSGRTYGVAWTAGLYKDNGAGSLQAGTALGVVIFTDGSPHGSGTSYIITAGVFLAVRNPKIVWDGQTFVVFWTDVYNDLNFVSIPEMGPGSPIQVKRLGSEYMVMGTSGANSGAQTIGTFDANGKIALGRAGNAKNLACQPGDVIMIDKVQRVASLFPNHTDGVSSGATFTSATGGFTLDSGTNKVRYPEQGGPYTITTSPNEMEDEAANFTTAGIQPGMEVVIVTPTRWAGRWIISSVVDATHLAIKEPFPVGGPVTGFTYYIDRGVRPGDTLVITTGANNGRYFIKTVTSDTALTMTTTFPSNIGSQTFYIERRFDDFKLSGPHVVRGFDPLTGTIGLELLGSTWQSGDEVVGSILSGGIGSDASLPQVGNKWSSYTAPAATRYEPRNLRSPDPSGANVAARLLGSVYLDPESEYVLMYETPSGYASLTRFSRETLLPLEQTTLAKCLSGTLAWNGKNLLAVWIDDTYEIQYALLSPTLVLIETGFIARNTTNATGPLDCPIGNLPGQQPGPLYDAIVLPTAMQWQDVTWEPKGTLQPRPKKVEAKWNDRLGRWVVSASYVWAMEGTCGAVDPTPYENNPAIWPLQYDDTNGGSVEQPASLQIGGTYVGRVITGRFYVPLIQPGMRIFITDSSIPKAQFTVMKLGPRVVDPNPNGVTPTDIYTSITVDVDASELTPAEVVFVTAAGDSRRMWAEAREDVFVWTLQQGAPAVQVLDADGCALSNVTLGGTPVDISEMYTNAARPTWRTAGEIVGAPLGSTGVQARVNKRPYTRSFLTPEASLETVRLDNVRSRVPVKYGRHGPPGLPVKGVSKPEGRRS